MLKIIEDSDVLYNPNELNKYIDKVINYIIYFYFYQYFKNPKDEYRLKLVELHKNLKDKYVRYKEQIPEWANELISVLKGK